MADGNFNRNILPYNNYRSGLRAGHSAERTRAIKVFEAFVNEEHLAENPVEAKELVHRFAERLRNE